MVKHNNKTLRCSCTDGNPKTKTSKVNKHGGLSVHAA